MSAGVAATAAKVWDVEVCPGIYGGVRVICKGVIVLIYTSGPLVILNLSTDDPNRVSVRTLAENVDERGLE